MSSGKEIAAWLPGRLAELVQQHGVPGAQVAVLVDGEMVEAAAGVLSLATGVETTTDSVFQIGSITKVWTATLVLQLVDEGLLDLDEPVVKYLPEFKVSDAHATATVTPRMLLSHTSGIDGDLFHDTGRGDDAVEKYIPTLADAQQVHEPGAMWSYCNSGYCVLGRIVEVLRGKPYGAVLRERIAGPLCLEYLATNADEAIMYRAAVGHVGGGAEIKPAPVWSLAPSNAPAGSLLSMRAKDLLTFARTHLDGGGEILSAAGTKAMRERQASLPHTGVLAEAWGLGWELFGFGADVFGHDGNTIGQSAFLRVSGDAKVAVALLTNGGDVRALYQAIIPRVLGEYAAASVPQSDAPPADPIPLDAARVEGTYRTPVADFRVTVDDTGRGRLTTVPRSAEAKILLPESTVEVVRLRDDALITVEEQGGRHVVYGLIGSDSQGRAQYLFNGRAARRVEEEARTDSALEELYREQLPSDPTISPDGSRIVYVLRCIDRDRDENVHSLWQVGRDGSPRRLTRGRADTSPRFSPDGTSLAFLRSQDGPPQLWLLPMDGGEPERMTDLPLGAGVPVWSPDGTRIAFAAMVNPSQDADDAPIVTDRLVHKFDGLGRLRGKGPQLFVLDLADHAVRQITHESFMGVPAWSQDGTKLLCADSMATYSDGSDARAYLVDPSTSDRVPVGPERGDVAAVAWHGSAPILVAKPDEGVFNQNLLRVDGDSVVTLTAELDRNVMPGGDAYPGALPQAAGDTLLFCARDNGCTHLYAYDGSVRKLVGGDRVVSGLSVAGDVAAIVLSTVDSFGEVAFVDVATGSLTVVTDYADGRPRALPQARTFRISDGVEVNGWVLRAPQAPTPGPLLVDVHGGPHNAWNPVRDPVHLYHQELLARGWTILLLNPRASDGYGEKFLRAALGAWGEADEQDFLEPVETLVAEGIADPARLALTGYSYGGFMSCWLSTRTTRFAAVVAGGVSCDMVSMSGTSDVGAIFRKHEIGEDMDRQRALSPISGIAAVTSPTLVLHGASDERCPVGQAEQWYHGLRSRDVPTELVLYPGESHLFIRNGKPSHRLDYNRRTVDWLVRHTGR